MTRAPLVLLLVSTAAAAAPAKLTMRVTDATNLHIANEGGAIHWDEDTTVTVELGTDGKVAASVAGTRKEHNLYARAAGSYNTDDVTTWSTAWTGTFKRATDKLELVLALASETCSRVKTTDGASPEKLACRAAAKQTTVTCTSANVTVTDPAGKSQPVAAWMCSPGSGADLGESPSWLLGKSSCLEVSGGHAGTQAIQPCRP